MQCDVDGLNIFYETRGEGFPVIMLHGFGIDHNVMTGCMEPIFAGRPGWKRIYPDLPGMGKTPGTDRIRNSDHMLQTMIKFTKQIVGSGHFLIVGESYGGYLTRGFVREMSEQVAGICLICPVIFAERDKRTLPQRSVFVKDEKMLSEIEPDTRKFFERMIVLQDRKRWERFQVDILPGVNAEDKPFTDRLMKNGYSFSFEVDRLNRPFEKPSIIFAGRQDATVGYLDALRLVENFPRGTFAILDRAGHGLEVEQETVFNCLLNEWLDRVIESFKKSGSSPVSG